ncbi:Hypothetical protein A7982_02329 [Minicystis rosea]|nr:Hypothetical protein A7982_02329 [Minicystis rosea]
MFNGTQTTVTVKSPTPGADVYLNGGLAGPAPAQIVTGNAAAQVVTVHAPGHRDVDIVLTPKVKAAGVVCDVLWSLTIIGLAAPISDGLLGTFVALDPKEIDVKLEPAGTTSSTTPVREASYSPGDVVRAPEPPPPPTAKQAGPPKPCRSPVDCTGGASCKKNVCVSPECITDAQCAKGKYCDAAGACTGGGGKR